MKHKKIAFNTVWILFAILAISKNFLHFFINIIVPSPFRSLLSNLPYVLCLLCFLYAITILNKKMSNRFILIFISYILFFSYIVLRDLNLYMSDTQFIPYFIYSLIIFISFSMIDFSDNFFLSTRSIFIVFVILTPVLLWFYVSQSRLGINFDYMFFGQAITPIGIFYIFQWKYSKKNSFKEFFIYLMYIAIILLFCNRGSLLWIILACMYIYITLSVHKKFQLFFITFIIFIGLLFSISKVDFSGSRTIMKFLDNSIISDSGRSLYYTNAKRIITEHPFFGIGVFSSRAYLQDSIGLPIFTSAYPHNFFLEVFMQFGLVFPLFIFFLLWLFFYIQLYNSKEYSVDFFFYIFIAYGLRLLLSGSYLYDFSVSMLLGYFCNNSMKKRSYNEVISFDSILQG